MTCNIIIYVLTPAVRISQLFANHCGIRIIPAVITHCSPLVIDTHFHSTLIPIGATNKTNIAIGTSGTRGTHYMKETITYNKGIYLMPENYTTSLRVYNIYMHAHTILSLDIFVP